MDNNQDTHETFLQLAVEIAREHMQAGAGGPFGAVIVRNSTVIGRGWNRVTSDHDPTAHGEVRAIQDACRRLGARDLAGAVIYISGGAPCPMCATACYWAGLERLYHATDPDNITDAGAPRYAQC